MIICVCYNPFWTSLNVPFILIEIHESSWIRQLKAVSRNGVVEPSDVVSVAVCHVQGVVGGWPGHAGWFTGEVIHRVEVVEGAGEAGQDRITQPRLKWSHIHGSY